jgi:hypothetical protein
VTVSAWDIPGWTAQHPSYPPSTPVILLPDGANLIVITGTFAGPAGGAYGMVTFTPKVTHLWIGDIEFLLAPVRFEVRGGVLINAAITAVPQDAVWTVREAVGPLRRSYDVILRADADPDTPIDLTALERVTSENYPSQLFTGDGPPGYIVGAVPGDEYLDRITGDVYTLEGSTWVG